MLVSNYATYVSNVLFRFAFLFSISVFYIAYSVFSVLFCLSFLLLYSMSLSFFVQVYRRLPLDVNTIAVNKYIIIKYDLKLN